MALCTHRMSGQQVEGGDPGRLPCQRRLGVLSDKHSRFVVVSGKEGVGGILRIGGAVERDDEYAFGPRLPDRRHDSFGIADRDEDHLRAGGDHVLHGRHLPRVVTVVLARAGEELGTVGPGHRLRALLHLYEEGVGFGLGDEADDRHLRLGDTRDGTGRCEQCEGSKAMQQMHGISTEELSPCLDRGDRRHGGSRTDVQRDGE